MRPVQTIRFSTSAEPQAVVDFYGDELLGSGWTVMSWKTPTPDSFHYYWTNGCDDPDYSGIGTLTRDSAGTTLVEIELTEIPRE
jgi:hypothetical protein